jgi:hypothetical protein
MDGTLFLVRDDLENEETLAVVKKSGLQVNVRIVNQNVKEIVETPWFQDKGGYRYFGMEEIQKLVN